MQRTKNNKLKKIIIWLLLIGVIVIFALFTVITISYATIKLDTDTLASTSLGVQIYDASTTTNSPIYYSKDRKIISSSYLQEHTVNAFISIEDKRFYQHNGYDIKRIAKSALVNLKTNSKTQGASTITQQLIKNTLLNSEKTYSRKFKEVMLAIKTEKTFTKQEILDMYLNSIYFGSDAYGIESASNLYFNKSASELSINESAILAGIIKSPAYYSPINHPENCFARKNVVLEQMFNNGYITEQAYIECINLPVEVAHKKNNYDNSYNQQAIIEACNILNISEKELMRKDLRLYTYLDRNIQCITEHALLNSTIACDKLSLVADSNGKVIAYVGDSYFNLSTMRRNPASTIKPLLVYLPAIATNTLSPATPLLDEKLNEGYSPRNAGDSYLGWISTREALAHSSNVCAVKVLDRIGIDTAINYAKRLGINVSNKSLSLALGDIGNGVKVVDLAHAYSILQNNGIDKGFTFISKIEDSKGKVIYQDDSVDSKIFEQEDCMLINDMLKSSVSIGTAKRLNNLPFEVASKTGTSQINGLNNDLWNIAYTTKHLTLTWCGDASSQGLDMSYSSSFYPTMINYNILSKLYTTNPSNFKLNDNIKKIALDNIEYSSNHTLALSSDDTPERYKLYELFKVNNTPSNISSNINEPTFNINTELSTNGAKITFDYNPAFNYELFSIGGGNTKSLAKLNSSTFIDDKVFNYNQVEYYIEATNKYNNKKYTSEHLTLYPEEFLVNMLNNQYIAKNQLPKSKWYV